MSTSRRATTTLTIGPSGVIELRIVTPLSSDVYWAGMSDDDKVRDIEGRGMVNIGTSGHQESRDDEISWRWVDIGLTIPGESSTHIEILPELHAGARDRAMIETLVRQRQVRVPVVWVREEVESSVTIPEHVIDTWQDALDFHEGISEAEWNERVAQMRWETSLSYQPGIPRPRPHKPRKATLPDGVSIPFFAPKSGRLPKKGPVTIAGVDVPAGSRLPARWPTYWATDDPVQNAAELASLLAAVFPETGLWPMLWTRHFPPGDYLPGNGNLDAIDTTDADELLGGHPTAAVERSCESFDPFTAPELRGPATLLVVPCNRPADAVTMLGGLAADYLDGPQISAILRSWEQRLGAVITSAQPTAMTVAIREPLGDADTAAALANELRAIWSDEDTPPDKDRPLEHRLARDGRWDASV